jgi:HisA/HisF family protein
VQIIGVVDVLGGQAVHAVAGARERYKPVHSTSATMIAGDAGALARHYIEDFGVDALYVADLDAIQGGSSQDALVGCLCQLRAPVYLDAGVSTLDAARHVRSLGVSRVIVGLETLASFAALQMICAALDADVVFSLDLRDSKPLSPVHDAAEDIAARAADMGVREIILLDLARVGMSAGFDLDLIARVRAATPAGVSLLIGGGVRGLDDLNRLAAVGCDGALVATALQNGTLTAAEVARARSLPLTSRPR